MGLTREGAIRRIGVLHDAMLDAADTISAMPDSFDRGWNAAIEEGQKALIEMKARADPWHVNVVRAAIRAISQLKKDTGDD